MLRLALPVPQQTRSRSTWSLILFVMLVMVVVLALRGLLWDRTTTSKIPYDLSFVTSKRINHSMVNLTPALDCLGYSSPIRPWNHTHNVTIVYPIDPLDHFLHIHQRLEPFLNVKMHKAPGYQGPWIENHWQDYIQRRILGQNSVTNDNFRNYFGPYVPLLPAWTDIYVQGSGYRKDSSLLADILLDVLRPSVIYITLCQNDDGFPGNSEVFQHIQDRYHIVILSAGGYGHVPIPLLKQFERPSKRRKPVHQRKHLLSYVGRLDHAPHDMRRQMMDVPGKEHYYYGRQWRNVMRDSKFSLCPRGFGRTSYHVMEALQMGLIPIQVYMKNDIPWMPYATTVLNNLTFTTTVSDLPTLISKLQELSDMDIEKMEQDILALIPDYFTYAGVLQQIQRFMVVFDSSSSSALVCQPLPPHPGTNRPRFFL